MYRPLVVCPACSRHVKSDEGACPFCAAELDDGDRSRVALDSRQRMGRAAAFMFGVAVSACGASVVIEKEGGTSGAGGASASGGGGNAPSSTKASTGTTASDMGGFVDLYGGPGVGSAGGVKTASASSSGGAGGNASGMGGDQALYGSPPPK